MSIIKNNIDKKKIIPKIESFLLKKEFMSFNTAYSKHLLNDRKITKHGGDIRKVLLRIFNAYSDIEKRFNYGYSETMITDIISLIDEDKIVLGTPILTYAGKKGRAPSACTVVPIDLHKDKEQLRNKIAPYYKNAMGSGYDFSVVKDPVKKIKEINDLTLDIENFCDRPVASIGLLHCNHPKVYDFINSKRSVDFSKWRFNISIICSDEFMEAVENNTEWELKDEHNIVTEIVKAQDLFHKISASAHYCGEPGVLFMDRFDDNNPVPDMKYESVAPCAEIAMAPGEVCQFSYLNLSQFTKREQKNIVYDFTELKKATRLLVRMLDDNVEISIDNAIGFANIISSKRRIGIGVCGLADLFITMGIPYDSKEAMDLVKKIMSVIQFESKVASVELAKERGPFPKMSGSRFEDEEWFMNILGPSNSEVTLSMKEKLWENLQKYGIRNAGTTAIPPTGTSARFVSASTSIEPRFSLLDSDGSILPEVIKKLRVELDNLNEVEVNKLIALITKTGMLKNDSIISSKLRKILTTARELNNDAHLNIVKAIQCYLDESISKTFNMDNNVTSEDVYNFFIEAYRKNLRGVTVFRDGSLQERDITSLDKKTL